jgi:hypothetical protein
MQSLGGVNETAAVDHREKSPRQLGIHSAPFNIDISDIKLLNISFVKDNALPEPV